MADLSYEAFKSGKLKPAKSNDLSYESFLSNKKKVAEATAEKTVRRSQGLPVSVKEDRAKPTVGGSILRTLTDIVPRLAATVKGGDIKTDYYGTSKASGQKGQQELNAKLAKEGRTKATVGEALKTIPKDLASILGVSTEAASYGVGGGAATGAVKTVGKQALKTIVPKLILEGGAAGLMQGAGHGASENKPFKNVVREAAVSGAFGAVLNTGLGIIGNKFAGKALTAEERAFGKGGKAYIPEAGTPPPPKPEPVVPDFTYEPIQDPRTVPQKGLKTIQAGDVPQTQTPAQNPSLVDKPNPAYVPPEPVAPEVQAKITEGADAITKQMPESVSTGNNELYSQKVYEDITADPEKVRRIALGQEVPTNGVPSDAYYAIMKNEASKSGDLELIKELANSKVATSSSKKLNANKLATEDNIVDIIKDIQTAKSAKLPKTVARAEVEYKESVKKLKQYFKENNLAKDDLNKIMNELRCK